MSAVINLALGATLFFTIGFYGLALATTIAGWTNVLCLIYILMTQSHLVIDARLKQRLPRVLIASIVMAALMWWAAQRARPMLDGHILTDYTILLAVSGSGVVIYALFAVLFKAFGKAGLCGCVSPHLFR